MANTKIQSDRIDSSNQSYVRAYRSSNVVVATSTSTTAVFDTVVEDTLGEYNNATGIFTANEDGVYAITSSARWTYMNANVFYKMTVYLSGSGIRENVRYENTSGDFYSQTIEAILKLSAGDTMSIAWWQNSGGNETITGDTLRNTLMITKVS